MGLLEGWFCMGEAKGGRRCKSSSAAILRHFIAEQASRENRPRRKTCIELLKLNGAPNGMSACGFAARPRRGASAPCALRWKTLARFRSSVPCRVRIPAFGQQKARYREGNGLLDSNGAPNGIRTRDIHLERVASLAARRWGRDDTVYRICGAWQATTCHWQETRW